MKLPVVNAQGKELRSLEVDDSVFGIEPNHAVLHQAFITQRNNQRAGTANTKTRGMVQGSTRKVRMQKYTGRARHGSIRAPIYVGGGIVFGPQPRDFGLAINKKMRRLAIRSALSGKVADGQLIVIDELAFKAPRTKEMLGILRKVGIERSALIVTGQADRSVLASARNIHKTKVLPAAYLNVGDMLNHAHVLMTEEAVKVAEGLWGSKPADGRRAAKPAAGAPAPEQARPSARRRAKAEAPPAEPEPAKAQAASEAPAAPKARARARTAKPAEEPAPPRRGSGQAPRPARRVKAAAKPPAEEAPKPRRRTKKSEEPG
ncbi:MAG: 50S ribosomal protein L4 [Chloroflexi bacterium]|nr:MAG: 50S ribosomal protein L4 [Chloroflexota bacterium]